MARITRLDKFIDALIDGTTDNLPPPLSRLEKELYEGIKNRKPEDKSVKWEDIEGAPDFAPEEHSHDWEDIENTPFVSTAGDTVKYIGNANDLERCMWNDNVVMVKISDAVLTEEDLMKGMTSVVGSGSVARESDLEFGRHIYKVRNTNIHFANLPADPSLTENGGTSMYFIPEDNCDYDGMFTVPSKGVWIMPDVFPVTVRINGYTGFSKGVLTPTALPDHTHTTDDIIALSPNGTKYKIAVTDTGMITTTKA